jgi:cardiolipin synthase
MVRRLRRLLRTTKAARRGVDVCLLVGVGEFRMQDAVAASYYPELLASGVRIVEYRKTQLHAKVAVVDDDWATVGSSNCDALSLFINQEAARIQQGIADGAPVDAEDMKKLSWVRRYGHEMAYLLYKLTMRVFTIGYA